MKTAMQKFIKVLKQEEREEYFIDLFNLMKNKAAQTLAKIRWGKTTKEQRSDTMSRVAQARWKYKLGYKDCQKKKKDNVESSVKRAIQLSAVILVILVGFGDRVGVYANQEVKIAPVAISGQPVAAKEWVLMDITRYSAKDSCHYGPDCPMANTKKAEVGYVACPRTWKLGTKIEIDGLGFYECGDRYNKNLSDRIDIFNGYGEEAYREAINFGIKKLNVRVIE